MGKPTPEEMGEEASKRLRDKLDKAGGRKKPDPLRDNPPAVRGMKEKHHTLEGGESNRTKGVKGRHRKDDRE